MILLSRLDDSLQPIQRRLARRLTGKSFPESRQVSQWFLGEITVFESCCGAVAIVRLYGR